MPHRMSIVKLVKISFMSTKNIITGPVQHQIVKNVRMMFAKVAKKSFISVYPIKHATLVLKIALNVLKTARTASVQIVL